MKSIGLLIVAILSVASKGFQCFAANVSLLEASENVSQNLSKQENHGSMVSKFRQLNSIEPFLEDRARQLANNNRQGSSSSSAASSQMSLSSYSNNDIANSNNNEQQARQLTAVGPIYPYPQPSSIYQYGNQPSLSSSSSSYVYPASGPYSESAHHLQQSHQQHAYQQGTLSVGNYPAYRLQDSNRLLAAYSRDHGYLRNNQINNGVYTNVVHEQAMPQPSSTSTTTTTTTTSSPQVDQYKAQLPQLREVIELADPNVKVYATKAGSKGQKSAQKTIVGFRMARKILASLNQAKVMQPEFYIQEDPVTYSAGTKNVNQADLEERPKEVEANKSRPDSEVETTTLIQDENSEETATQAAPEGDDENKNAKASSPDNNDTGNADGASNDDDEAQADKTKSNKKTPSKLKEGELQRMDAEANKRKPETDLEDKILNDFGKDKLDKLGNFLHFGEKHATKLAKKVGLEHKSPDEAEREGEQSNEENGLDKSEIKSTGDENQVLRQQSPPVEVSSDELGAASQGESQEDEEASEDGDNQESSDDSTSSARSASNFSSDDEHDRDQKRPDSKLSQVKVDGSSHDLQRGSKVKDIEKEKHNSKHQANKGQNSWRQNFLVRAS